MNETHSITVSVVIPTKNNAGTIAACIEGILAQKIDLNIEVVVIDSGSTDGTLSILSNYPIKLYRILPEEFNHGGTRNLGASLTSGEIIIMTVADAFPANEYWLKLMLRHFEDFSVVAVCGLQIAPVGPQYNPLQRFRPISQPEVRSFHFDSPEDFERLAPESKAICCALDNVSAAYRRSALIQLPFTQVSFGEDMGWAKEALKLGWKIVFDPTAQVFHYHIQSLKFTFKRSFIEQYYFILNFGFAYPSFNLFRNMISNLYQLIKDDSSIFVKLSWYLYNQKINFTSYAGKILASLCARTGNDTIINFLYVLICKNVPTPNKAIRR